MTASSAPTTELSNDELLPWSDPEFRREPWPWFARLHADYPILQLSSGSYVFSKYDLVMKYAKDRTLAVMPAEGLGESPWSANENNVLLADGDRHTALRRSFNSWFSPKAMRDLTAAVQQQANTALDQLGDDGVMEAHRPLGVIAPQAGIAKIMGLPHEDALDMVHATNLTMMAMTWDPTPDEIVKAQEGFGYMMVRVDNLIDWKRSHRGDGSLLDHWLGLVESGEWSERMVKEHLQPFWAGAGHNPGYIIASGLEEFSRDPDLMRAFREQPEVREDIVNELIRMRAPEMSLDRWTTQPTDIEGTVVPTNTHLRFLLGAALRDPEVFENPGEFNYKRPKEASMALAFGLGRHSCPGTAFSRMAISAVLGCVAERFSQVEIIGEPNWMLSDRHRNCEGITVRFS